MAMLYLTTQTSSKSEPTIAEAIFLAVQECRRRSQNLTDALNWRDYEILNDPVGLWGDSKGFGET